MARKCASAAILETLHDPRVLTLPAAAQLVWVRTVTAMQNAQISVMRFGSDVFDLEGYSMFAGIRQSDIEAHLEVVIGRGLLVRERDGAINCPMLAAAMTRSEINRRNGQRGGRPPKNAQVPGQKEMMLPIKGGKEETQVTENVTETGTERQSEMGSESGGGASSTSSLSLKREVSEEEFHAAGEAVLDACGVDRARSYCNYGIVRQWLVDGADQALIVEVISGIMARPNAPVITHSLNYFNRAIADAIKGRPPKKPDYEKAFERAMALWQVNGSVPEERPVLAEFKARAAS